MSSQGWRKAEAYSVVQVVEALTAAQKVGKPPLSALFTDVYKEMPWHLAEQQEEAYTHAQKHPECLHGVPL